MLKQEIKTLRELAISLTEYIDMLKTGIISKQLRRYERRFKKIHENLQDCLNRNTGGIYCMLEIGMKIAESLVFDCYHMRLGCGVFENGVEGYISDLEKLRETLVSSIEMMEKYKK